MEKTVEYTTNNRVIQSRSLETKRSGILEASDEALLQGVEFLYPDVLLTEFLRKELLALRFYLLGIMSYPETFLKMRLNKDDLRYLSTLRQTLRVGYSPCLSENEFVNRLCSLLQISASKAGRKKDPNLLLDAYFAAKHGRGSLNIGQALTELFGVSGFGRFPQMLMTS